MTTPEKRMEVPLEANPEIFNPLAQRLGLDTSKLCFHDVLGFDDELLALVPQPVLAVILLYPGVRGTTMHRKQKMLQGAVDRTRLVHIRQRVGNVCGFMAMLHVLGNTPGVPLAEGSQFATLFKETRGLPMEEASDKLDAADVWKAYTEASLSGQSETPPAHIHPEGAFCAFIEQDGQLVELDGWNDAPLLHGPIEKDLVHSVVKVVRDDIIPLEQHIRYNILALAAPPANK
ncbi:cysteine proteinase [Auriculariales sp. MPI-PUGE-AT-0066]|nr:cysteine proteinase [Auriculariales sp. MPI-PUGE-AT-0066]